MGTAELAFLRIAVYVLGAILAAHWGFSMWLLKKVGDQGERIARTEVRHDEGDRRFSEISESLKEIKDDVKTLLRNDKGGTGHDG